MLLIQNHNMSLLLPFRRTQQFFSTLSSRKATTASNAKNVKALMDACGGVKAKPHHKQLCKFLHAAETLSAHLKSKLIILSPFEIPHPNQ